MSPPEADSLVPLQPLIAYAEAMGWTERKSKRSTIRIFAAPQMQDMQEVAEKVSLVLPSSQEFADSDERIRDAVRLLAEYHNTSASTVAKQIREPLIDSVLIKPVWRYGGKSPLSLTVMSKLISLVENLMVQLVSGAMEDQLGRITLAMARRRAELFSVRLIEPDGLRVESSVVDGQSDLLGRSVMLKLSQELVQSDMHLQSLHSQSQKVLSKIVRIDTLSSVRFSVAFGLSHPPPPNVAPVQTIELRSDRWIGDQELGVSLRSIGEVAELEEIVGVVSDVNQKSAKQTFDFSIMVRDRNRERKYWIELPSEFLSSIAAAAQLQRRLRAVGYKKTSGNKTLLTNISDWEIYLEE